MILTSSARIGLIVASVSAATPVSTRLIRTVLELVTMRDVR